MLNVDDRPFLVFHRLSIALDGGEDVHLHALYVTVPAVKESTRCGQLFDVPSRGDYVRSGELLGCLSTGQYRLCESSFCLLSYA